MSFNRWSDTYESEIKKSAPLPIGDYSKFVVYTAEKICEIIEKILLSNERVKILDWGCGNGVLDKMLQDRGFQVAGIDVSPKMIDLAKRLNPGSEFQIFDGVSLPIDMESVDVCICVCTLQHIAKPNRKQVFREMFKSIKRGGILIIYEHNRWNPLTRATVWRCPFENIQYVSVRELKKIVLDQPYKTEFSIKYHLSIPRQGQVINSLDRLFENFPLGVQYTAIIKKL